MTTATQTSSAKAADAATTAPTTDGATPPPAAATAKDTESMSLEEARATLRGARVGQPVESDPLLDEGDGRNPLTDEGVTLEEVLGIGGSEEPTETETTEAAEETGDQPTAETEAVATEGAPEDDGVKPPDPAAVKTEADGRKRVNINRKHPDGTYVYSEQTRAALLLADEEGIDYEEARQRLFGDRQPTATKEAAPVETAKTAKEIDAEITTLRQQRRDAVKAFDEEKQLEITEKIDDLQREFANALLREATRQQSQRSEQEKAQAEHTQKVNESMGRAAGAYPDAVKENSELNLALAAEVKRLERVNPAFFADEEWPEALASKLGTRLGIAPVIPSKTPPAAKPAAAKPAVVPPAKRATPVPAPGAVSAPPAKVDPRAELARRIEEERDPAKLKELMREAVRLERSAA